MIGKSALALLGISTSTYIFWPAPASPEFRNVALLAQLPPTALPKVPGKGEAFKRTESITPTLTREERNELEKAEAIQKKIERDIQARDEVMKEWKRLRADLYAELNFSPELLVKIENLEGNFDEIYSDFFNRLFAAPESEKPKILAEITKISNDHKNAFISVVGAQAEATIDAADKKFFRQQSERDPELFPPSDVK